MANLTITIPNPVLKRARLDALNDLLKLSEEAASRRGDRSWSRDELHERNL